MELTPTAFRRYILLAFMLLSTGVAAAQEGRVTFSGTHITVGKAMSEIQAQRGYKFVFNSRQLDTSAPVRFSQNSLTVKDALVEMFGDAYACSVHNRFIAVSPNAAAPGRDNPAARETDNRLTNDRYRQSDPHALNSSPTTYDNRPPVGRYQTVRTVTVIPAEPVIRNYPASYSAYTPPQEYALQQVSLPKLAVKTNLLYGAAAQTPNLVLEIATAPRQTFVLGGSYRWWGRKEYASENHKQLAHWIIRPEYRWWACERFNGHYFGAQALYSRYFVSGYDIPLLFDKENSYNGHALGAGITYGYHWPVGPRIGLEFNIALGYAYLWGDRGSCRNCDWGMESHTKHYFGPTRAGIDLVFMIN